ncbi:hypothetical protein EBU99_07955 [bacterium]|nr:hypothetical protein [bacterium]
MRLKFAHSVRKWPLHVAAVFCIATGVVSACVKSKPNLATEQDALTQDMTPHNFATEGYTALNGGWSGMDFKARIFADERYGKENFLQIDGSLKQIQFFTLDSESRVAQLPGATLDDALKAETALGELLKTEPNINTPGAVVSFLRLGALVKDFNIGLPKPITMPFTLVTNRDELPYSPKPNAGPEWNQFIRDFCGGFQNPNLGFFWIEGSRKLCLRLWTGTNRQLLKIRSLVTLPRSHTSSAQDARVSPWLSFTRAYTAPAAAATPTSTPSASGEPSK